MKAWITVRLVHGWIRRIAAYDMLSKIGLNAPVRFRDLLCAELALVTDDKRCVSLCRGACLAFDLERNLDSCPERKLRDSIFGGPMSSESFKLRYSSFLFLPTIQKSSFAALQHCTWSHASTYTQQNLSIWPEYLVESHTTASRPLLIL